MGVRGPRGIEGIQGSMGTEGIEVSMDPGVQGALRARRRRSLIWCSSSEYSLLEIELDDSISLE